MLAVIAASSEQQRRIAGGRRADGLGLAALVGVDEIAFDAGHHPAHRPVVAGLDAEAGMIEAGARTLAGERCLARIIDEARIGPGRAPGIPGAAASVEIRSSPRRSVRRLAEDRCDVAVARGADRRSRGRIGTVFDIEEQLDGPARLQDLILVELRGVADIGVEQIVADQAGGDLDRAPR